MAIFDFLKRNNKKDTNFSKNWQPTKKELYRKHFSQNGQGFSNFAVGFGGVNDVTMYSQNNMPDATNLMFQKFDNIYRTNVYAQRIINAPADDMTRKWREFVGDDPTIVDKRTKAEVGYLIRDKFNEAIRYANLYGGAGLLIVLNSTENWSEPLDYSTVRKNDLIKFQPIFLGETYGMGGFVLDPTDQNFGKPLFYNINNMPAAVHHSRIILFDGVPLSLYARMNQTGFGDSKLTSCLDILQAAQMTYLNIANLIARANVDVVKIKDFAEVISNNADNFFSSLRDQAQIRSSLGIMAIDSEDDFVRNELTGLGTMGDLLMTYLQMIASIIPMPLTKLLGTSVDGFGTGINEIIQYYDEILAKQNNLSVQLRIVDEIMERSVFGDVQNIKYNWLTLYEPTSAEKATVDLQKQQEYEGYQRMGIVSDQAIARKLKQEGIFDLSEEEILALSDEPSTDAEDSEMQELLGSVKDVSDGKK